ncbi:carbamoyltransferase [bacterium]|nr:carbamoyltransferase [bacterium]
MKIIGISAFYHDSSACLIDNGQIIAACQEERLTRIKHDSAFPAQSIKYCLEAAACKPEEIDCIVFYEKPFLKFERLLETYLAFVPRGFVSFSKALPLWLTEKLFQKKLLRDELRSLGFSETQCASILFSSHHLSHAASAFYPSPHNEALVLTMDGVGEWDTTTVYIGNSNKLQKIKELHFPHSLGLLYSAFTYYCGFKVNSGEYKLMGLAPFGKPIFAEKIKNHLIDIKSDGSFKLDMSYFDYCTGLKMTNSKFDRLFEFNRRNPEEEISQVHMDLAASIQFVLEEVVLKICKFLAQEYKIDNLCLAGGVALNCVGNGKIYEEKIFKNIWIQPAAGDAGGSLGAALAAHYLHFSKDRPKPFNDSMKGSYLGPQFSEEYIENFLKSKNIKYTKFTNTDLYSVICNYLSAEKVIGWFQGRMEFGPRALGNRSIIADARSSSMQKKLNLKIKFRESFRPFAPAILSESVNSWFKFSEASPYMLMVAQLQDDKKVLNAQPNALFGLDLLNQVRSSVPAITHVDYSARIQTVHEETNPKFYNLIKAFNALTGTPLLINTSFNIRGEPVVCTPEEAFRCFMGTDMDVLVLENFVLLKDDQDFNLKEDYRNKFSKD